MKVKPRIVGISATGSKIDIQVEADGVLLPVQRVHASEIYDDGATHENAILLARYIIRQEMNKRGGKSRPTIEQIKAWLEQGVEADL
jgi:hypothetical protein